jgi:hypothetical protein
MRRRLLNELGRRPRPKLNPPPFQDFYPSDFASCPEDAWEIADIEVELEEKEREEENARNR